jgi:hypothetical protein
VQAPLAAHGNPETAFQNTESFSLKSLSHPCKVFQKTHYASSWSWLQATQAKPSQTPDEGIQILQVGS